MRDLLQVATRGGSGSAARALGSGLAGIRTGTRRLLVTGAIGVLLVYLGWDLVEGIARPASTVPAPTATEISPPPPTAPTVAAVAPSPSATVGETNAPTSVGYSISLSEVSGLAESTRPGTVIDIWVTWDPPLTKVPKLQRVVRGAIVDEVVPPVTPDGPHVATLSVAPRDVEDLLWADRYGSLSAITRASS